MDSPNSYTDNSSLSVDFLKSGILLFLEMTFRRSNPIQNLPETFRGTV